MKKIYLKIAAVLMSVLFMFGGTATAFAADFHDVGPNLSWAREAINAVSTLGIMTGDFSGNFSPNDPIDKFETVRILARMSGFNLDALNAEERAYYNTVFEARRNLIESFSNQFELWNSGLNREIAYLLYTGVLLPTDLQNFVVIVNGQEALRALSREETAVFLVRFMGRTTEALRTVGVRQFNDDALISPGAKPHVYYLRSLGIMNGDNLNNVSPRAAVNRAAMAILVHSTLKEINSPLLGLQAPAGEVDNIAGTITNSFPTFRSIQIAQTTPSSANRILSVSNTAIITINGLSANFSDLQRDMSFTAVVSETEIVSITVSGGATPPPTGTTDDAVRTLDGTVARVSVPNNTIGIETRMLNPRGEIISEIRDYTITGATSITRAGSATNLANVTVGDLVVAEVMGNNAVRLQLEERFREVSGTLMEKNFTTGSLFPILVVQDAAGVNHSFSVDNASQIRRQGTSGNIPPRSLRIGDTITLQAEYGRVTEVFARGTTSVADVYVRDIFISGREQSYIVVTDTLSGSPDRRHLIIDGAFDVHSLVLGSRVRLWLDSQEVSSFTTLQTSSTNNFTGNIVNITGTQISVRDANFVTRNFTYDSNTVFFNSVTGSSVNVNHLSIGMRIQVVTTPGDVNRATSVTVLANQN